VGDPAERLGRYEILRRLGSGAMGEVYLARDGALGREVAIKRMRPMPGIAIELYRARFEAEARALAALRHPAVIAIHDIGWEGDAPYLVMELVPGGTLRERIEQGPLPPAEVAALGIRIGGALAAAHAAGILHRDVKPANVLGGPGEWKLADFGIAHVPGEELTLTGQLLGTPAYAAPEALADGAHSPAADVWGLGATLYAAATGAPPYGGSLGAVTAKHHVPVVARAAALPASIAAAIDAALDRDPARRPTATALCEQLAAPEPRAAHPVSTQLPAAASRPRWMWPAIAGGAIAVIGLVALAARGGGSGGSPDRNPVTAPGAPAGADPVPVEPTDPGANANAPLVTAYSDGSISIDESRLGGDRPEEAAHRLHDAVHQAEDGHLDHALDRLHDVLEDNPNDAPVTELYNELETLRENGYGDEGPPGHRKHGKGRGRDEN
jgi:tRNA A-37 threonylcarbamoyl transferase component Bud32